MADTIQLRAGNKEGMPTFAVREVAYCEDENALYIGTSGGNKKVYSEIDEAVEKMKKDKLTAKQLESMATVAEDANVAAVITAFNNLLAALKESGIMKT